LGAAHFLRVVAGLATRGESHFAITRNLQQLGANLTCQVGREHVAYTLEATNDTMLVFNPFKKLQNQKLTNLQNLQ